MACNLSSQTEALRIDHAIERKPKFACGAENRVWLTRIMHHVNCGNDFVIVKPKFSLLEVRSITTVQSTTIENHNTRTDISKIRSESGRIQSINHLNDPLTKGLRSGLELRIAQDVQKGRVFIGAFL